MEISATIIVKTQQYRKRTHTHSLKKTKTISSDVERELVSCEGRSGDDDDTRNQNAELSNVFICRTCLNVL